MGRGTATRMTRPGNGASFDIAVVGAGAAGLMTAITAARAAPGLRVVALDGARRLGAKIRVSGGGRCNVTNRVVTPADFHTDSPPALRRVLAAFDVPRTREFFAKVGVALKEEQGGKLFPVTNRADTVVQALLGEAERRDVRLWTAHRVLAVARRAEDFALTIQNTATNRPTTDVLVARRVVLATGGLSLPKTGSDGAGYAFAQHLGHTLVPTTPALVPLTLAGDLHRPLAGVAHEVELTFHVAGERPRRLRGPLLWTHFGISGPVVLDASRHWLRAQADRHPATLTANFLPGDSFPDVERWLIEHAATNARKILSTVLSTRLPARIAAALPEWAGVRAQTPSGHLPRDDRRRLIHALLEWPLPITGSRGYTHAEVTAGGVPLAEVDPDTMASRRCPGLHLVGEIVNVDGRIGGFNFQWAWAGGHVAGTALAACLRT